MKGAAFGSVIVHVGLTLALLVIHPARGMLVPGPDVVQVSLVDVAAAAPAPAAAAAPPAVAPSEERGVRLEPPKREKPQAAKPVPPAPAAPAAPTAPAPRVVLPYANVGGGLSGEVAVDESNFEFAYYLQRVRTQVAAHWAPPGGAAPGTRVEVYFRIARDGAISAPRIERSSGSEYFDQAAARAVILAPPLPPLPLGYSGSDLGIHFGFEYTGP